MTLLAGGGSIPCAPSEVRRGGEPFYQSFSAIDRAAQEWHQTSSMAEVERSSSSPGPV